MYWILTCVCKKWIGNIRTKHPPIFYAKMELIDQENVAKKKYFKLLQTLINYNIVFIDDPNLYVTHHFSYVIRYYRIQNDLKNKIILNNMSI